MEIRLYLIDAALFTSRETAHDVMQNAFWNREYVGRNLDALYDVLTSIRRDAEIRIYGMVAARRQIGEYADRILAVYYAAATQNPHLRVLVQER